MKKGFTLIELLVVVLIIGILAAVALPQYQKAVFKARMSEAFANLQTLKNAVSVCTLAQGNLSFCSDMSNLDIAIGEDFKFEGGNSVVRFISNNFFYQVNEGIASDDILVFAYHIPTKVCLCAHKDGHFSTMGEDAACIDEGNYPSFNVANVLNIEENEGCACC